MLLLRENLLKISAIISHISSKLKRPPISSNGRYKIYYPTNIGLTETREATIRRWEKIGLLDGLKGLSNKNSAKLFEANLSYKSEN